MHGFVIGELELNLPVEKLYVDETKRLGVYLLDEY